MFLINSCSQLVSSTDFSSIRKGLHLHISVPSPEVTAPFCLVPSPEFSQAPEYSLPDHLCRFTVRAIHALTRGFSRQHRITNIPTNGYASRLTHKAVRIYQYSGPHAYTTIQSVARLPSCVTPSLDYNRSGPTHPNTTHTKCMKHRSGRLVSLLHHWSHTYGYGNINPLTIDYACRPRLRPRLTLGRLT